MPDITPMPPAMHDHYRSQDEGERLARTGHGRLELVRTRDLLARLLPPPPARVLDVGGATGVHATWLAGLGYDVHLVDPVPEQVRRAQSEGGFTAAVGDARALDEPDGSVDAVLLLGPLYHLVDARDRLVALGEARRVLRHGGVVLAAAIGRYMALLDWAADGALDDSVADRLRPVVASGRHDPSLGFTDAYFHTWAELESEVAAAGFADVRVLAVEGPAWMAVDAAPAERLDEVLDSAVRCAGLVEDDPALLPMSAHLMAVGRRD